MTDPARISVHLYELRAAGPLNARTSRRLFEGALIRLDGGYGCLHPWPELGDAPLSEHLKALRRGEETLLTRRSLFCCVIDSQARKEGRSLFTGLQIPESHYTLPAGEINVPAGFGAVKIKGSLDLDRLTHTLAALPPELRLRLDFNETLDEAQFQQFAAMAAGLVERIDFIEDPMPWEEDKWRRLQEKSGIPFAMDRPLLNGPAPGFIWILKPARDDIDRMAALAGEWGVDTVITSSMDHPVGQSFAAWEAARLAASPGNRLRSCGLVTHHLFDAANDPFLQALNSPEPRLRIPAGMGLGFDNLLANLSWKPLTEIC